MYIDDINKYILGNFGPESFDTETHLRGLS